MSYKYDIFSILENLMDRIWRFSEGNFKIELIFGYPRQFKKNLKPKFQLSCEKLKKKQEFKFYEYANQPRRSKEPKYQLSIHDHLINIPTLM
jgi:hypothetical protein